MTIIADRSGDIKVTRRSGYWLLEQDHDVISLSDESMASVIEEAQRQWVKDGME